MDAFKFLLPAVQKIADKLERAAVVERSAVVPGRGSGPGAGSVQESRGRSPQRRRRTRSPPARFPHMERILLNALLASDEARDEVLPRCIPDTDRQLRHPRDFRGACEPLVKRAIAVTFSALESRLTPRRRAYCMTSLLPMRS